MVLGGPCCRVGEGQPPHRGLAQPTVPGLVSGSNAGRNRGSEAHRESGDSVTRGTLRMDRDSGALAIPEATVSHSEWSLAGRKKPQLCYLLLEALGSPKPHALIDCGSSLRKPTAS